MHWLSKQKFSIICLQEVHLKNTDNKFLVFFLAPRRFHHSLTGNSRWLRERSHESYAKNYSVVFPYDEPLAGRNMRKDPLYEVRAQLSVQDFWRCGGTWEKPGGTEMA